MGRTDLVRARRHKATIDDTYKKFMSIVAREVPSYLLASARQEASRNAAQNRVQRCMCARAHGVGRSKAARLLQSIRDAMGQAQQGA